MKKQYILGILFLLVQLISIIYARVIPERFFCWAPYDEHTYIEVFAEIDDIKLTKNEIQERYHYKSIGWEPRSIHNIINIINQYESTYGKEEKAIVQIIYSTNGRKNESWHLKK